MFAEWAFTYKLHTSLTHTNTYIHLQTWNNSRAFRWLYNKLIVKVKLLNALATDGCTIGAYVFVHTFWVNTLQKAYLYNVYGKLWKGLKGINVLESLLIFWINYTEYHVLLLFRTHVSGLNIYVCMILMSTTQRAQFSSDSRVDKVRDEIFRKGMKIEIQ